MIPEAAVEEVAAILYDLGAHQSANTFEAVRSILRDSAKLILEAAAPHMLAEYRAQIAIEYAKADERRHMFRAFHEKRDAK